MATMYTALGGTLLNVGVIIMANGSFIGAGFTRCLGSGVSGVEDVEGDLDGVLDVALRG
ncbi:unnamed protein product [Urochloa humidicola]